SQRHAGDELADQETDPLRLADVVNGHDTRVAELGGASGLAQETVLLFRGEQGTGVGHLDGDGAPQLRVEAAVDGAYGAGPEALAQQELAQARRPDAREVAEALLVPWGAPRILTRGGAGLPAELEFGVD